MQVTDQQVITIDPLSCVSLRVELRARGNLLSTASAFVVQDDTGSYLVSNWHVLAGRHPNTDQPLSDAGALPDEIVIVHHTQQLGSWKLMSQPLVDAEAKPLWIEHPGGREIDIAALPLDLADPEIKTYPLDLALAEHDVRLQPAMAVSIIGYPFGLATGVAFPIWKTGHIASDPDINYDDKPVFLIDATTRGGMSGSPVVYQSSSGYLSKGGALRMGGSVTAFLGVYSGRIRDDSEIGRVWRPKLVGELLGGGDA